MCGVHTCTSADPPLSGTHQTHRSNSRLFHPGRPDVPRSNPDEPAPTDNRWTSRRLPPYIYQQLRHGFVRSVARELVHAPTIPSPSTTTPHPGPVTSTSLKAIDGNRPGRPVAHPGAPFGTVVAWLWDSNKHEIPELLADLLTELQRRPRAGQPHPPITLDELLDGLHLAMPSSFDAHEFDQLAHLARTEVPRYLSTDPNPDV